MMNKQFTNNFNVILLLMLAYVGTFYSAALFAAEKSIAIKQMAGILLNLHHFPGQGDKDVLKAIIDNKSTRDHERTIANAILNLNHKATASDITKLIEITMSRDATENEKDLATSIINLNHEPTPEDKKRLELMK